MEDMNDDTTNQPALLWVWRHYVLHVDVEPSVEAAIDMARAYAEHGEGSTAGIEVNGGLVDWENHPHNIRRNEEDEASWDRQMAAQAELTHRVEMASPGWLGNRKWVTIATCRSVLEAEERRSAMVEIVGPDRVRVRQHN